MVSFINADRERIEQDFKAKLKNLPFRDGVPDVSALGDPVTAIKQWATEIGIGLKETLGRLFEHLAKFDGD